MRPRPRNTRSRRAPGRWHVGAAALATVLVGGTATASAPPTDVPVAELTAGVEALVADHPELEENDTLELDTCPAIDLDGLDAVLADAGTAWQVEEPLEAVVGSEDVDDDDLPPASAPVDSASDADSDSDVNVDGVRCDAWFDDGTSFALLVATVPDGYTDFSIDPDGDQTVTPASADTLGGELYASCEPIVSVADGDDRDDLEESTEGAACAEMWLSDGLAIGVHLANDEVVIEPDDVRAVLLTLVPALAAGELAGTAPTDGSVPTSETAPDGVALPGGEQPAVLLDGTGTWFDGEGRLYLPEATGQTDEEQAAFCEFLFGRPDEVAAVFGAGELTLFEGSGFFNNGGNGVGWRCGYRADLDDGGDVPHVILGLSTEPFDVPATDEFTQLVVLDGGDADLSGVVIVRADLGVTLDEDVALEWLTAARDRAAVGGL